MRGGKEYQPPISIAPQGFLTALCEYQWDDSLRYRSQVNGFIEVWQDKSGRTSFENTKLHYMGTQWPPIGNENA